MRPSRGMGDMKASKMPKAKTIRRKDNPDDVTVYAKGGKAKGGKFIQNAIKKPGALRSEMGVKKGEKIPAKALAAAAKKPGKLGQRARFAQLLKGFKKGK
jgi:hypothetical protein